MLQVSAGTVVFTSTHPWASLTLDGGSALGEDNHGIRTRRMYRVVSLPVL